MLTIWFVMWYGNGWVSNAIDKYVSWLDQPARRFAFGILGTAAFSTLAILGLAMLFRKLFSITIGDGWSTVWVSIVISVAILLFMQAREFLFAWRDLALRQEKMRNELLVSKYEVLKNQVNPHFMFNGLNALSTLVYEDPDLASNYIDHLSKVLRYILQSRDSDLVGISEELDILESYIFLEKIRFGPKLDIQINLEKSEKIMIAPMVLQMLIENAIKHNELTDEYPLRIHLYSDDEYLYIENSVRIKDIPSKNSSKVGLENIKDRYHNITDHAVVIDEQTDTFIVKIPVVKS